MTDGEKKQEEKVFTQEISQEELESVSGGDCGKYCGCAAVCGTVHAENFCISALCVWIPNGCSRCDDGLQADPVTDQCACSSDHCTDFLSCGTPGHASFGYHGESVRQHKVRLEHLWPQRYQAGHIGGEHKLSLFICSHSNMEYRAAPCEIRDVS